MFRHMLTPKKSFCLPETSLPSLANSYVPAWKARCDELTRLCERASAKVQAAQRLPTIFDTSLVKHWTPELVKPQQEREGDAVPPCHHAAGSREEEEAGEGEQEECSAAVPPRSQGVSMERITILQLTIAALGNGKVQSSPSCVHT